MKLMRLGPAGHEKPAVRVDENTYVDVSDITPDFDERFFAASEQGGGMLGLEAVVRPVADARTWLLTEGWLRHGRIGVHELSSAG